MLNGQGVSGAGGTGLLPCSHSPKLTRAALGTSFAHRSFPRMTPAASSSWSIQVLIGHHLCATPKLLSTEILSLTSFQLERTNSLLCPRLNSTGAGLVGPREELTQKLRIQWGRRRCQLAIRIKALRPGVDFCGGDQPPLPYRALGARVQIPLRFSSGV